MKSFIHQITTIFSLIFLHFPSNQTKTSENYLLKKETQSKTNKQRNLNPPTPRLISLITLHKNTTKHNKKVSFLKKYIMGAKKTKATSFFTGTKQSQRLETCTATAYKYWNWNFWISIYLGQEEKEREKRHSFKADSLVLWDKMCHFVWSVVQLKVQAASCLSDLDLLYFILFFCLILFFLFF